ncbi:MAG TPA: hypothetical protein DDY68_02590 [Porphyromonadaceae bacterium]|nr:hypothetical protein [Porphyromonadaceae bacterium]
MKRVFFFPWVGSQYASGGMFGKKIMVLGDSHYCGEGCETCGKDFNCNCNLFTRKVMEEYLNPENERKGWMSTYLKFERSLVNHETSPEESLKIWNSLLFYNYLQLAMNQSREAGTFEQYRNSAEPFFSVLEQYQPDGLIVWGIRLWGNLPNERWIEGKQITIDDYSIRNGYYELRSNKRVRAVRVYHPSAGYSWDYWYRAIHQAGIV